MSQILITLALYFSRPVRLFRPSKISGWHSLGGQSLPLLIRQKGWIIIPGHFAPPLLVNALLGTVLWTTYSEATSVLSAYSPALSPVAVAAISGSCAGSVQALAAAPAENVRIVLEGGKTRGSWSVAWKEVFAGTEPLASEPLQPTQHREEARKVREWVREVRGMAGRGWQGLGFGVAKDSCAFAVFFAIFEISRRVAARTRNFSRKVLDSMSTKVSPAARRHVPRVVHSVAIISGGILAGISYEFVSRPFDVARRCIHVSGRQNQSMRDILLRKAQNDGLLSFFRDPAPQVPVPPSGYTWLRTLGRLGPWGVAFLAWENFGPELLL
ncbi:hypothetical protein BU17DRAFT_77447 [Hysterangium stoloniferum]|nr:hypothetical protein BU17DRAFT_77447 [Hysterangium stoloniferum]